MAAKCSVLLVCTNSPSAFCTGWGNYSARRRVSVMSRLLAFIVLDNPLQ